VGTAREERAFCPHYACWPTRALAELVNCSAMLDRMGRLGRRCGVRDERDLCPASLVFFVFFAVTHELEPDSDIRIGLAVFKSTV